MSLTSPKPHLTEFGRDPAVQQPYVAVAIEDFVVPLTLGAYSLVDGQYEVSSHLAFGKQRVATPDEARRLLARIAHRELSKVLPMLAKEAGVDGGQP